MYWTIADWKGGDTAHLIIAGQVIPVEILKVKGSPPPQERGNVQVRFGSGDELWVKGGELYTKENAEKQVAYEMKKIRKGKASGWDEYCKKPSHIDPNEVDELWRKLANGEGSID